MGDAQEMCGCGKPDVTVFETCLRCGNAVSFEELRQQAVDIYDEDDQPIEDAGLPRRHSLMKDPKRCLRLLHLDDSTSHVLSGRFESDWIQHVRPYEAISYTWGGEEGDYTKTEFIIIDGKLFPITKNCAAVLLKIRKPRDSRAIWIDSLCINQNDVNERSVQVSQMGQIFSGAQKVHIYIGNNIDDITASTAFKVLSSIWNLSDFNTRLSFRDDEKQAAMTLFSQTYFSRMWIIQEVLLAKTAELHWGTATIPWQMFNKDHLKVLGDGIGNYVPEWMKIRANKKNFRNSETLGALLFSAMGSTASNNRDKVYGIYGLLLDAEEEGLTVDYSLSGAQVFTNMAAHLIKKHNALRAVLRHANHDAPLLDGELLPSWVPDFRSRSVPKIVSISRDGFKDLDVDSNITLKESISIFGPNELCLRGHRLTMPGLQAYLPTEYSDDRTGENQVRIQARFPVAFDPEDHTVFWMPDGALLQLKRHPTAEDAHIFLGECAIKHIGTLQSVLHYRCLSDVMYGLELQDLESLWKFCMNLDCVSHRHWDQFGLGALKLPDTSMGWDKAEHVLNAYDFVTPLNRNRTLLEPGAQQMLQFLCFCQSDDTWKVLENSKVFEHQTYYNIQDIKDLCLAWLQCYEAVESLIEQSSKITHEHSNSRRRLRLIFLDHLEIWEKTTETLSNALRWTESLAWPFEDPPRFHKWDWDEDVKDTPHEDGKDTLLKKWWAKIILWPSQMPGRDEGKKKENDSYGEGSGLSSVIRNNFNGVRFRFDLPVSVVGLRDSRVDYVLEPWSENWVGTIRSIPYLFAINEQLSSISSLGDRVHQFKRRGPASAQRPLGWKSLEVWPAETITLL
ncbi:HET domain-containing protein [Fusarium sp. LHS14.1]|nr:HET domain-containing protein [Fusarium sp. LHS14.1]